MTVLLAVYLLWFAYVLVSLEDIKNRRRVAMVARSRRARGVLAWKELHSAHNTQAIQYSLFLSQSAREVRCGTFPIRISNVNLRWDMSSDASGAMYAPQARTLTRVLEWL